MLYVLKGLRVCSRFCDKLFKMRSSLLYAQYNYVSKTQASVHDFSERPTAYNFLHRIADEVAYVRILMFSTSHVCGCKQCEDYT